MQHIDLVLPVEKLAELKERIQSKYKDFLLDEFSDNNCISDQTLTLPGEMTPEIKTFLEDLASGQVITQYEAVDAFTRRITVTNFPYESEIAETPVEFDTRHALIGRKVTVKGKAFTGKIVAIHHGGSADFYVVMDGRGLGYSGLAANEIEIGEEGR